MSNQTTNSSEEIDLFYLFSLVGNFFKKCFIAAYRFIVFLLKNWIILLVLITVGVLAGYFLQKDTENPKEANALIRINFDTVGYVYNTIDLLNDKIINRDSVFLKEANLWKNGPLIKEVKIEPVISFKDIASIYGRDNATLKALFENYEYENGNTINTTFKIDFKYHSIAMVLAPNATPKSIDYFIKYLNTNDLLDSLKDKSIGNIEERISTNEETIKQINNILNNYNTGEIGIKTNQITLDKDLTGLVRTKMDLQREIEEFSEDLILSKGVSVLINKSSLIEASPSKLSNKMIVYPILLIFLFLSFALLIRAFNYARKLAQNKDAEKQNI